MRRLLVVLALAGCASSAPPATTPPKPAARPQENEATRHLENGKRLFAEKSYPEALTAFNEAYRIGASPEALRYVALAQRQLHHPAAAYDAYEQLLEKPISPELRREAQKAIEELGAITGTLIVAVNEPDAEIEIDGRSAGRSPMARPRRMRANDKHAVRVTKTGFMVFEQTSVEVVAGDAKKIEVKLEPDKGAAAGAGMSDAEKKSTARAAFTEGVSLQEKGDCRGALARFETAQRLHDAPTHLLHMAQCQAMLGKLVEAQESYEALAHSKIESGAPDAFQKAQDQGKTELATLKSRVPTLKIQATPRDAVVQVNGTRLANDLLGLARPTNPGTYKITATATGYKAASADVVLAEKEQKTVDLKLLK